MMQEEIGSREIGKKPLSEYSRDLLQNFPAGIDLSRETPVEESEDIELNLRLSLGGCFGVDPCQKPLIRSSAIVGIEILQNETDAISSAVSHSIGSVITRVSSLPTEAEEKRRKRKEMQSQRRMELKRRRTEKQKNYRAVRRASVEKNSEKDLSAQDEGLAAVSDALCGFQRKSQGSLGSQGSSPSVSDLNNRNAQGLSICMEAKSPTSSPSSPKHTEQKPVIIGPTGPTQTGKIWDNPSNDLTVDDGLVMKKVRSVMEAMPCVSTKVEGPSGRKIEGFLYKYKDGEEVRIVCLCHGRFLSPAEFVKHGGGGDVAHPLRHILVNTSSSSFL